MQKMDCIRIENLEVYAYHGVFPEENKLGQIFVINADLYIDATNAAIEDDLSQSVHYGEVCQLIKAWMDNHVVKLIETVADTLAKEILLAFPLIQRIVLEVKKPNAPIPLPVTAVSVTVDRQWHTVYVGIGSNIGDREAYIQNALLLFHEKRDCIVTKVSNLFLTAPYGYTDQPEFLNGAFCVKTLQTPEQFLDTLHEMEHRLGRERNLHWGPRTIDLDILLYDDLIMSSETLTIPHIDMENRLFVLKPMDEIAGFVRHPVLGKTIHQLCMGLEENEKIKEYKK